VPTIGIGAGVECSGQVLVIHDLLNLSFTKSAKFVRQYADLAGTIRQAVEAFKTDVEGGTFPSEAESYHLPKETAEELEAINRREKLTRIR
jgi:3-methyl-2-oxobutanoate hydroxymethyltransferase